MYATGDIAPIAEKRRASVDGHFGPFGRLDEIEEHGLSTIGRLSSFARLLVTTALSCLVFYTLTTIGRFKFQHVVSY